MTTKPSQTTAKVLAFDSIVITGYYKGFKTEMNVETENPITLEDIVNAIDLLELAGFKGTTFERKEKPEDLTGKFGKIDLVEKTKTKNGKDAFVAHIKVEDDPDREPVAIMFFAAGAARKGDRVKITKNESGYMSFDLVDENGEKVPF